MPSKKTRNTRIIEIGIESLKEARQNVTAAMRQFKKLKERLR